MKNAQNFHLEVNVGHCYEEDDCGTISIPVLAFIGADGQIVLKLQEGAKLCTSGSNYDPKPYDGASISEEGCGERRARVENARIERRLARARRRQAAQRA